MEILKRSIKVVEKFNGLPRPLTGCKMIFNPGPSLPTASKVNLQIAKGTWILFPCVLSSQTLYRGMHFQKQHANDEKG